MSGDVQPRRRKDKKRKRDDRKSEGEVIFSRKQSLQDDDESSHGVHSANMGADDQHIHVHEDHGTGGNWYQKCAFIVLMAILLGLVGLIIMENRGLADLDTPLSESRYSDYLHGWVEEHREEHDDHDEVKASIEEHDEHDEPFEEEEDHSEADDEDEDDHDDDDDEDDDHDKDADAEEVSEEATVEQTGEVDDDEDEEDDDEENNDDDDDEQVGVSQADDDDEDNEEEVVSNEADDDEDDNVTNENDDDDNAPKTAEDDDDDNDDDDDVAANDDNDNDDDENNTEEEEATAASRENDDNQDDDNNDDDNDNDDNEDDDDNNQADDNDVSAEPSQQASASRYSKDNDFDDPFDEEDDDGIAESFESIVVDNDAEERVLLQEKERRWAEQNQPPKDDKEEDEPEESHSFFTNLAVKFGVGVALALVARFVLMRKNPNQNAEPSAEDLMKRRLTISSAEVVYPDDEDAPPLSEDEEQHASGEELEMEEEIEYVEEEEEIEIELDENDREISPTNKYVPETFEDFNAMYRPKDFVTPELASRVDELKTPKVAKAPQEAPITLKKSPAIFTAPPPPPLVEAKIEAKQDTQAAKVSFINIDPAAGTKSSSTPTETTIREVTHDMDFQPDEDDIDYTDEDDDYDEDEEIVEEEEEEIEDLLDDDGSDVDDTELMNRLEAKYGRLPTNEYESDEDPDDPTWTQIKPKQTPGGGPQTQEDDFHSIHNKIRQEPNPNIYEDDEYEREMAFANDEMLRGDHIGALVIYFRITQNYPDRPMGFLRKATLSNQLGKIKDDTGFMLQSVEAYKRYLAFDDLITNDTQFREAAEECIKIMRDLGQYEPAITIHRLLLNRFQYDPELRNGMVITFLMMDRYHDAKVMLLDIHKKWPQNGLTLTLLGYVLKTHDSNFTGAAHYLQLGIDSNAKGTQDARFYIALGESYERLGKHKTSFVIYKRGAELKLYPSEYQRSVYNEYNLRAQPIWTEKQTSYENNFKDIASQWQIIRDEAIAMLESGGYFRKEMESLVATGNWKELELFSRGVRNRQNCKRAPTTCWLIEQFPAATKCRRGQVKFSVMHPGTHVRPHCGPTNCRLRAHLGLLVPQGTKLRVASQNISWTEGDFLIFDDSFEHEVWHDGKHMRLILIVDFWHPDLSEAQIARLSTI